MPSSSSTSLTNNNNNNDSLSLGELLTNVTFVHCEHQQEAARAVTQVDDDHNYNHNNGNEQDLLLQQEMELIANRKRIIKQSWTAVRFGLNVKATEIFYNRLFSEFPFVRTMFPTDMRQQQLKLYHTLSMAVKCLDSAEFETSVIPLLKDLGCRHALAYGALPAFYEAVVECFIWTLNTYLLQELPPAWAMLWAPDVSDAWEWALNLIGSVMANAGDEALQKQRFRQQKMQEEEEQEQAIKKMNGSWDDSTITATTATTDC